MEYKEVIKQVCEHIKKSTGAKEIEYTKDYSECLSYYDYKSVGLTNDDPSWMDGVYIKKDGEKKYTPFFRIHLMGIAYKEETCDLFDFRALAIARDKVDLLEDEYVPILKDMDEFVLEKISKTGYCDSPKSTLDLHVFKKDNSYCAYSYSTGTVIKRSFEGEYGCDVAENTRDRSAFFTFKDNNIYIYEINTGYTGYEDGRTFTLGQFDLISNLYYTDDKKITKVESIDLFVHDFGVDEDLDGMEVTLITFEDGTQRVLAKKGKKQSVSDYHNQITFETAFQVSISEEQSKEPANKRFVKRDKYDEDGIEYTFYSIPGVVFNYIDEDYAGRLFVRQNCTQDTDEKELIKKSDVSTR